LQSIDFVEMNPNLFCNAAGTILRCSVFYREGDEMKVALASRYRMWMLLLLPATAGVGTIALWLRTLNWPHCIDGRGLTLRYRRRIDWHSVTKIGLSRSYLDGHCARLRIHHAAGTCDVPLDALRDGQGVVRAVLTMFDQARNRRAGEDFRPIADTIEREPLRGERHGAVRDQGMHRLVDTIIHPRRWMPYGVEVELQEEQA
jgi:hypothetical protein